MFTKDRNCFKYFRTQMTSPYQSLVMFLYNVIFRWGLYMCPMNTVSFYFELHNCRFKQNLPFTFHLFTKPMFSGNIVHVKKIYWYQITSWSKIKQKPTDRGQILKDKNKSFVKLSFWNRFRRLLLISL